MKLIYVAGPFRAKTPWEVELNIRLAEIASFEVWKLGYYALCPHAMGRFFDRSIDDELVLAGTLEMMCRCDAVLMVGEWERSEGAKNERVVANSLGIPVFETLYALDSMLKADAA